MIRKNLPPPTIRAVTWQPPDDPKRILPQILIAALRQNFIIKSIGCLPSGDDIVLLQHPAPPGSPAVLVAAGFHGEETGGPLGVLRFLETAQIPSHISLSILPVVNPTGLRASRRHNDWGENPNDGFCHPDIDPNPPSKEGQILLENLVFLRACAREAFLSLHEDGLPTGHVYAYGMRPTGAASAALAELAPFGVTPDGVVPENGAHLVSGLSLGHHDGSFEDRLYHEGVPLCLVTETPRKAPAVLRAAANDRIVRTLLAYIEMSGNYQ